jgi:hypothetical protein
MEQIIIAIHISSGQRHEFSVAQWTSRVNMTDTEGRKLYRFKGTENKRSLPLASTRGLATKGVPKKKGCGCGK